VETQMSYAVS